MVRAWHPTCVGRPGVWRDGGRWRPMVRVVQFLGRLPSLTVADFRGEARVWRAHLLNERGLRDKPRGDLQLSVRWHFNASPGAAAAAAAGRGDGVEKEETGADHEAARTARRLKEEEQRWDGGPRAVCVWWCRGWGAGRQARGCRGVWRVWQLCTRAPCTACMPLGVPCVFCARAARIHDDVRACQEGD